MQSNLLTNRFVHLMGLVTFASLASSTAFGQVSNTGLFYAQNYSGIAGIGGAVGKYDLSSSVNNPNFVLQSNPSAVSASAGNLFVATYGGPRGSSIGEYSETTGGVGTATGTVGLLNGNLISGLAYTNSVLSVGTNLFVGSYVTPAGGGTASQSISAYTVVNGVATANNAQLISGLPGFVYQEALYNKNTLIITDPYNPQTGASGGSVDAYTLNNLGTSNVTATPAYSFAFPFATGLALYGDAMFVSNPDGNVGEYNASNGAAINAGFLKGLGSSYSIAVSGNYLIVCDYSNSQSGTITRFDLTSSNPVATATILSSTAYEVLSISTDNPVPEPATVCGIFSGAAILLSRRRRRSL